MRTFTFAFFIGIIAFALGILFFGRIEDEKITFDRVTWEKVNSFREARLALISQPVPVYICGGAGFLLGGFSYLAFSIIRKRRKVKKAAKAKSSDLPGLEIVPSRGFSETHEKSDLERLEAERPLVCKILGFTTLGVLKFYAVPQGNSLVVTTLGKYRKLCHPGLGFIWSFWGFLQRPYQNKPLIQSKETTVPYERESIVTSDGHRCKLDVMICYRIDDPAKALFEVDDYNNAIENVVRAALRNECGKQPTQALHGLREQIADSLKEIIQKDVEPWGIKIRLVKISNIDVPVKNGDNRFDPLYSK
jgi:hypothetical protein